MACNTQMDYDSLIVCELHSQQWRLNNKHYNSGYYYRLRVRVCEGLARGHDCGGLQTAAHFPVKHWASNICMDLSYKAEPQQNKHSLCSTTLRSIKKLYQVIKSTLFLSCRHHFHIPSDCNWCYAIFFSELTISKSYVLHAIAFHFIF